MPYPTGASRRASLHLPPPGRGRQRARVVAGSRPVSHRPKQTTAMSSFWARPPVWSRTTQQLMREAGVNSRLVTYPGEDHTFYARWEDSIRRTVQFLQRRPYPFHGQGVLAANVEEPLMCPDGHRRNRQPFDDPKWK